MIAMAENNNSSLSPEKFELKKIDCKETIFAFFEAYQPSLHLYEIGDLDDFFFPYTTWYALVNVVDDKDDVSDLKGSSVAVEIIKFIVLLYQSPDCTVVLAFAQEEEEDTGSSSNHDDRYVKNKSNELYYGQQALLRLRPYLPSLFYSQLTPGLLSYLVGDISKSPNEEHESSYRIEPHGNFLKMAIPDHNRQQVREMMIHTQQQQLLCIKDQGGPMATRLESTDLDEILSFYKEAYPGNWFDPRMLETGQYYGIWEEEKGEISVCNNDNVTSKVVKSRRLCAIAGVHVYSATRKVAALGNITTYPCYRKKGYARIVTTALILSLFDAGVERVGLNVKADNTSAIALYESLGFIKIGRYEENMIFHK